MLNKKVSMYNILKEISFVRVGGTKEEKNASEILVKYITKMNVESKIEEFDVPHFIPIKSLLKVTKPYEKEYEATVYGMSGNLDEKEYDFIYLSITTDNDMKNAAGKIAMINSRMTYEIYKKLIDNKVAGFITFSGTIIDENDKTDLEDRTLREGHFKRGEVPGLTIRIVDAIEMINKKASKVIMEVKQEITKAKSRNIIATIEGAINKDEEVLFLAHFDSVPFSKGSYDNGAGSVIIMKLLEYYSVNKPNRTLKFVWCGSEEKGLLGSKDYLAKHKEELDNIKLAINVDMAGSVLGNERAMVSADIGLVHMINYLAKEIGYSIDAVHDIYSSDSTPFAHNGVPAMSFAKFSASGASPMHNRYDLIEHLSEDSLINTYSFIELFSKKIINSVYFPVPKKIPDNIKEKLEKYIKRTSGILECDEKKDEKNK